MNRDDLKPKPSRGGPLVLIGAGEFSAIAREYFTHDSPYDVVALSVNEPYLSEAKEQLEHPLPVVPLESLEKEFPPGEAEVFVAIPATRLSRDRRRLYELVRERGYSCASYVSSRAFVWRDVPIGQNCFIFESNTIQPFTSIGDNTILWSGNHVGHRTAIGSHVFVTSHVVISGYCTVGEHAFLGVNATINDGINIAPYTLVGAAAHVNRDTEPEGVYVGAPARPIPGRSSLQADL